MSAPVVAVTPVPVSIYGGAPPPVSPVSSQHNGVAPPANVAPEPTTPYSWREMHPDANLSYIRDHTQANQAIEKLDNSAYGFDLEWRPTFIKGQGENPVALVQIADHQDLLLLQVSAMREFPSKLREFLVNPNIIKAGVGIQKDASKLYRDWKVDIRSCVDLALLARTVDNKKWKGKYSNPLGLAHLVAIYEARALAKGKVTRSNWDRNLNEAQQMYAANDAHSGYVIYKRLMTMMPSVSPKPHVKYYSFDSVRGRLCDPSGATWNPFNPNYDPGPPPPPREPKAPNPKSQNTVTSTSPQATSSVAAPILNPRGSQNTRAGRGSRGRGRAPSRAPLPTLPQGASTHLRSDNNRTSSRRGSGGQRYAHNGSRRTHRTEGSGRTSAGPSQSSEQGRRDTNSSQTESPSVALCL